MTDDQPTKRITYYVSPQSVTYYIGQLIVILAIPVIFAMLPVRILLQPWIIPFEYNHLAPDMYGMDSAERLRLGLAGLESITETGGIERLRQAQFESGELAFTEREISHMLDVRVVTEQLSDVQLVMLSLGLWATVWLAIYAPARLQRALQTGATLTLAVVLGVGFFVLVAFDSFFTTFHHIFFTGDSWLFAYTDTLIRLYPVQFWIDVTVMVCVAIVVESIALGAAAWWWGRQARFDRPVSNRLFSQEGNKRRSEFTA
jgi:integral membrane protein (TIGR01906 family)